MHVGENEVYITLADNAGGVLVSDLPMLYEPYFSTKSKHKGMGLGLSIAKMIIEQHYRGSITSNNTADGLSTILVLPLKRACDIEDGVLNYEFDDE